VYQRRDPKNPKQMLKTWWIDYHFDGRRYRESSKSRRKADAVALLKRRMREHATGHNIGTDAKRLTFEELEAGIIASYELKAHRSLNRLRAAFNHSAITSPVGGRPPSPHASWSAPPPIG
jgi:hypothetical protein